ncbi:MAG: acyl carrier protein [Candidatus Omnitrophota bacterium]
MPNKIPDNLEEEVKKLIADVILREPGDLKPETNFWKDLQVDSIKAIEIVVAIEKRFKISIRDEQVPKITTIGEALALVKQALEKKKE